MKSRRASAAAACISLLLCLGTTGCIFGPDIDPIIILDTPPFIEEVQPLPPPDGSKLTFNLITANTGRAFRASRVLDFDLPDSLGMSAQFTVFIGENPAIRDSVLALELQTVQDDETRLLYSTPSFSFVPCDYPDIASGARTGSILLEITDPILPEFQADAGRASWKVEYRWLLRFEGECPESEQDL